MSPRMYRLFVAGDSRFLDPTPVSQYAKRPIGSAGSLYFYREIGAWLIANVSEAVIREIMSYAGDLYTIGAQTFTYALNSIE